jgi:hypothetical protein
VNGDGVRDVIAAPGVGGPPVVRIFDGKTGADLADIPVYEASFTGGLYVAAGDVNDDGKADIITGTGDGGGPRVKVLDGATLGRTVLKDYFAYEDSFRGGVIVAAGDLDGDHKADVITGTGVGGGPRVIAFSGADDHVLRNFFAYEDAFRGGVLVAAGDIDGDGKADIITGTGPGGGPRVTAVSGLDGHVLTDRLADDAAFRGGVRVEADDVNHDGVADVVARVRHGDREDVRFFDGKGRGADDGSISLRVDDTPGADDGSLPPPSVTVTRWPRRRSRGRSRP